MVKTYVLNDIQEGCFISEATDYERKNTDIDDQYIKLEDYNKLLELADDMLDDLIHEGMHVEEYIDEMKLIKGEIK